MKKLQCQESFFEKLIILWSKQKKLCENSSFLSFHLILVWVCLFNKKGGFAYSIRDTIFVGFCKVLRRFRFFNISREEEISTSFYFFSV
jgi:hypothetical protein